MDSDQDDIDEDEVIDLSLDDALSDDDAPMLSKIDGTKGRPRGARA